jgi:hypothetical protein
MTTVDHCKLADLPRIGDRRGFLTPIYSKESVPFDIKRVFYLYDIPGGASRAAHAHRTCEQFLVSVLGSFDVALNDGENERRVTLNRPYFGLYIPRLIWAELSNFSSGVICLVLTSQEYESADYVSDFDEFRQLKVK